MSTKAAIPSFEPIPQPPVKPSIYELPPDALAKHLARLAQTYGPIFELALPDRRWVITGSHDLAREVFDEKRFMKMGLMSRAIKDVVPTSIFAAATTDPIWSKAHRIMLPLFSAQALQGYLPRMWEATLPMLYKWAHLNPDESINVMEDMVRLTSDVIGLCCLGYNFQSFFRETPHPIMHALMRATEGGGLRDRASKDQGAAADQQHLRRQRDAAYLHQMIDEVIRQRRAEGVGSKGDMLDQLLAGQDRKTGEKLSDQELADQIITLLFAGHVTTSQLLTAALYELLRHPDVLARARAEIEQVLRGGLTAPPTGSQLGQLPYVSQILKETMRLHPPAKVLTLRTIAPVEILGGRYRVTADEDVSVLTTLLHRDRQVWGDRAETFYPERFLPEAEAKIPDTAFKPFGNGMRACLGRAFALQEAPLVLAMILHQFDLVDQSDHRASDDETDGPNLHSFKIQVRRRAHVPPVAIPGAAQPAAEPPPVAVAPKLQVKAHDTPLFVLYGSNLGTSETLARRIGDDARDRGFTVAVGPLDTVVDRVSGRPGDCAVVVVASSYNGHPPDNAQRFHEWLQDPNTRTDALKGVRFAVFGCGNKQWASTYQAVPRQIDAGFERLGAERVQGMGAGDASADFDGMFQSWYGDLWPSVAKAFSLELEPVSEAPQGPLYRLEVTQGELTPSPYVASYSAVPLTVLANDELQGRNGLPAHSTRCIEVELPKGIGFKAGDHLGVLAHNPMEDVERVATHFGCDERTFVRIHKNDTRRTTLPIGAAIRVNSILAAFVELHDVATRRQIERLAEYAELESERQHLAALAGTGEESRRRYEEQVLGKHVSLMDLLEEHPSCNLPLGIYLEFLAPVRPRYYSIGSSALVDPHRCRITVGVVEGPSKASRRLYKGTSSTFLGRRKVGEVVYGFVHDTRSPFRHPEDPERPIIMVGAGTGLAPFMGFLQERAALKRQGKRLGPSLLFFGCRHPEQDFIYEDELEEYAAQGLTQVHVAFSRLDKQRRMYVQDKILEQKDLVWEFVRKGASTFICGDMNKMVPGVAAAYRKMYQQKEGKTSDDAARWLDEMTAQDRYVVDIWGA